MLIAKVENGSIAQIADYRAMFQNRSLSKAGVTEDWLARNSCMIVSVFKDYDNQTEKLVSVEPYIENNKVYTVAVSPLTAEELNEIVNQKINDLKLTIEKRAQARLDNFAKTRQYDGILSLCTYATDPDPRLAAEGQYGVVKRSQTWTTLYRIMDEVLNQQRPLPTSFEEIEPELPVLEWPL